MPPAPIANSFLRNEARDLAGMLAGKIVKPHLHAAKTKELASTLGDTIEGGFDKALEIASIRLRELGDRDSAWLAR